MSDSQNLKVHRLGICLENAWEKVSKIYVSRSPMPSQSISLRKSCSDKAFLVKYHQSRKSIKIYRSDYQTSEQYRMTLIKSCKHREKENKELKIASFSETTNYGLCDECIELLRASSESKSQDNVFLISFDCLLGGYLYVYMLDYNGLSSKWHNFRPKLCATSKPSHGLRRRPGMCFGQHIRNHDSQNLDERHSSSSMEIHTIETMLQELEVCTPNTKPNKYPDYTDTLTHSIPKSSTLAQTSDFTMTGPLPQIVAVSQTGLLAHDPVQSTLLPAIKAISNLEPLENSSQMEESPHSSNITRTRNIQATLAKLDGIITASNLESIIGDNTLPELYGIELRNFLNTSVYVPNNSEITENHRNFQVLRSENLSFNHDTASIVSDNIDEVSTETDVQETDGLLQAAAELQRCHKPFFLEANPKLVALGFTLIEKEILAELDWMEIVVYKGTDIEFIDWNRLIHKNQVHGLKALVGRHKIVSIK